MLLKEGKDQAVFDKRLEDNREAVIRRGIDGKSAFCRICEFKSFNIKTAMKEARQHGKETGHTIDVYSSTHTEINYCNK